MKHSKILDRVEPLVGSEILCHPSYNIHPRLPGGYTRMLDTICRMETKL